MKATRKTKNTEQSVENLRRYLCRLEQHREKDEPHNKKAYFEARNWAAWLSVYDHGNPMMSVYAGNFIKRWW